MASSRVVPASWQRRWHGRGAEGESRQQSERRDSRRRELLYLTREKKNGRGTSGRRRWGRLRKFGPVKVGSGDPTPFVLGEIHTVTFPPDVFCSLLLFISGAALLLHSPFVYSFLQHPAPILIGAVRSFAAVFSVHEACL